MKNKLGVLIDLKENGEQFVLTVSHVRHIINDASERNKFTTLLKGFIRISKEMNQN